MTRFPVWRCVAIGLLATGVAACNKTGEPSNTSGQPTQATESLAVSQAGAEPTQLVPQIASGTAAPLKGLPTPLPRPTSAGERRIVKIDEAIKAVPFTLLEPKDLPADTQRDVVHLETAPQGQTVAGLPSVRFIYSVPPAGSLIVYQRPADGSAGTGETVDVGGATGWIQQSGDTIVLEWEKDGDRIQLRSDDFDRESLLKIAASMAPATPGQQD